MFGFGKKKVKASVDPLAAFDGMLEDLERQGAQVRRAAATLLALKSSLTRELASHERASRLGEERLVEAKTAGDARAEQTLSTDLSRLRALTTGSGEALALAQSDAELLLERARELGERLHALRLERQSAQLRLAVSQAVPPAVRALSERIERALALDEARDEVERAHALAEIYREDARERGQS